jgi:hypothetical protein
LRLPELFAGFAVQLEHDRPGLLRDINLAGVFDAVGTGGGGVHVQHIVVVEKDFLQFPPRVRASEHCPCLDRRRLKPLHQKQYSDPLCSTSGPWP